MWKSLAEDPVQPPTPSGRVFSIRLLKMAIYTQSESLPAAEEGKTFTEQQQKNA